MTSTILGVMIRMLRYANSISRLHSRQIVSDKYRIDLNFDQQRALLDITYLEWHLSLQQLCTKQSK